MAKIEELKKEVESLPADDYRQFRRWFLEKDWSDWDDQLETDVAAGKLDFLYEEALEEKRLGKLQEL
jgi:hypothetical protein